VVYVRIAGCVLEEPLAGGMASRKRRERENALLSSLL